MRVDYVMSKILQSICDKQQIQNNIWKSSNHELYIILIIAMNPEQQNKEEFNSTVISCLSKNERYFLVYPRERPLASTSKRVPQGVPDVFVYKNKDHITIEQLINKYNKDFKRNITTFQFPNGYIMKPEETIKDIKKKLRKNNIDGLRLYLYLQAQIYINECSLQQAMLNEQKLYGASFKVHFCLQPLNYSIYLNFESREEKEKIKYRLANEAKRIWGKPITSEMVEFKGQKKIFQLGQDQKMDFKIKGYDLQLPNENKSFLIIKPLNQLDFQAQKFDYESIKTKMVIDLLSELKVKADKTIEWNEYGLRIGQTILKSQDIIKDKCQILFKKSEINIKHLIGVVMKQSHIFEVEKSKIDTSSFNIEKILHNSQENQNMRKVEEKQIEKRANSASHIYFKGEFKNVQPIFLYTSILKVIPSNKVKGVSSLFRVLNDFLRNQNFAETSEEDYNKWQYVFQCILLDKLKKLPPLPPVPGKNQVLQQGWTNQVLWRGQGFRHQFEQNQIVTFKQFLSTSELQKVARSGSFSGACMFKIVRSKSGRSIKEYSKFIHECQVLFPSYTSFRVLSRKEVIDQLKRNIVEYEMQEVQIEPLPINKVNFILWVDDKTKEGKQIWAQFSQFEHTTVMSQLTSTQQLKKWLIINQNNIRGSTQVVNIAMISNMRREQQNGKTNEYAGVEAVKVFKHYCKEYNVNGKIFMYIGNRSLAIEKLAQHGQNVSQNLLVSAIPSDLLDFLKNSIKLV